MNICLVSYEYPPETFDGIGTYTQTLAQSLAAIGESVDVITFTSKTPHHYNDKGVEVHRINPVTIRGLWRLDLIFPSKTFAYSIAVKNKIREIMTEKRIDIIEGPEVKGEMFVYLLTRKWGRRPPVVVKLHTPSYLVQKYNFKGIKLYEKFLNFMEKQSAVRADFLTVPSNYLKTVLAKDYGIKPEKISILPNPVDTEAFIVKESADPHDTIRILFAGRIEKIKGVETLTYAIPQVLSKVPNCTFTFVGNDTNSGICRSSLRKELCEYLQEKCSADRVSFFDRVEKDVLIKYYQNADIVVMPSLHENLGYVCLEAMACGKAVVVSNAGGFPEIVENHKTGLLAPAGNSEVLADCIIKLCKDPGLRRRLGAQARKFVETQYSLTTAAWKTLDYYKEILARRWQA